MEKDPVTVRVICTSIRCGSIGDATMITGITLAGFLIIIVVGFIIFVRALDGNKPNQVVTAQYEMMARIVAMSFIAQEYGINPSDLKDLNNPQAMKERAKRIKAERELSAWQKGKQNEPKSGIPE